MEILPIVAIIGGVSSCLFAHQLAGKSAGSSDPKQSQTVASELQPIGVTHSEEIR